MIYGVMKMKEIHRSDTDFRHHYTPTKENALSLSAKTLYAGRLLRSRHWKEELHSHEFCEIVFVRSGAGFARIGDGSFEIKGGDILIYNAGVPHLERTEGKTPLELLFFACSGLQLNDLPKDWLLPKDVTPLVHSSGERMKRFETCFLSLVSETETNLPYAEIMTEYWTKLVLTGILRQTNIAERNLVKNATFSRIYAYLTENFANISSIEEVCNDLYVNKYYLSHVFKKYMGIPPQQYVIKCRLTQAKKLLGETDLSVAEISERCGYPDQTRFYKLFKKSEGVTPLAYRKNAGKPQELPEDLSLSLSVKEFARRSDA